MKLQGSYVDVAYAHREVRNAKSAIQSCRTNVASFHNRLYARAVAIAQSVGIGESAPRLASRQQHRSNIPAQSSSEYFRLNLTIALLDHLINELDTRFDKKSSESIAALMKLLSPACVDSTTSADAALSSLLSFYEDDYLFV